MLVNYDSKNGFSTVLDSLTKIKEITPDVKKQLLKLVNIQVTNPTALSESLKITDRTLQGFIKTMAEQNIIYSNANDAVAGYQSYLKTLPHHLDLADLKTKALATSMHLLSTIGWMAAITTATWAIGKLVSSINDAIHASEIAREKSNELTEAWNSENTSNKNTP